MSRFTGGGGALFTNIVILDNINLEFDFYKYFSGKYIFSFVGARKSDINQVYNSTF